MEVKNIRLCDTCKERVADFKCDYCEKDICKNDGRYNFINLNSNKETSLEIYNGNLGSDDVKLYPILCKFCLDKVKNLISPRATLEETRKAEENNKILIKEIFELIKKRLVIEEL